MFTSGSAAPSATMGDMHIAHSLAGTGEYMAAPCQRERKWEGGGRRGVEEERANRRGEGHREIEIRTGSDMMTRRMKQCKGKVF